VPGAAPHPSMGSLAGRRDGGSGWERLHGQQCAETLRAMLDQAGRDFPDRSGGWRRRTRVETAGPVRTPVAAFLGSSSAGRIESPNLCEWEIPYHGHSQAAATRRHDEGATTHGHPPCVAS